MSKWKDKWKKFEREAKVVLKNAEREGKDIINNSEEDPEKTAKMLLKGAEKMFKQLDLAAGESLGMPEGVKVSHLFREKSPHHEAAVQSLKGLVESSNNDLNQNASNITSDEPSQEGALPQANAALDHSAQLDIDLAGEVNNNTDSPFNTDIY